MSFGRRALAFIEFMLVSIWAVLTLKGIDVVYASSTPLTVGLIGRVAGIKFRVPFIFEVRDLWPEYIEDFKLTGNRPVLGLMRKLSGYLYRKAARIVVISDSMNERLQALYPVAKDKVDTVPLGSDMDYRVAPGQVLPQLGTDRFIITYTGSLGYVGAVDRLLGIAERLKDKGVLFIIAGEGKKRPELESHKKEKKLDNVIFVGKITKKQVFALIARAMPAPSHIYSKTVRAGSILTAKTRLQTSSSIIWLQASRLL